MLHPRPVVGSLVALTLTLAACSSAPGASPLASPGPGETPVEGSTGSPGADPVYGPGVSDESIKLGMYSDLTGGASLVGRGGQAGANCAVDEINANGGINGRTLEVVYEDSESTPDGGLLAARKLVQQENVFAILGLGASSSTVSVVPYAKEQEVPFYVGLSSDPRVLEEFSPWTFTGAAPSQESFAPLQLDFIENELGATKIALIFSSDAYAIAAKPIVLETMEERGLEAVTVQDFTTGDTDFTAQLRAVRESNPDVLFVYALPAEGARIISQARRAGITVPYVGEGAHADPQTIQLAGADAEGIYTFWFSSPQFISDRTGVMGEWWSAFETCNADPGPGVPNQWTLQAYTEVYNFAEGLRRAGDNLTRENFVAQLETMTDYVAGDGDEWPAAVPIGLPRTFTSEDHQGARTLIPVIVQDGEFKPAD